jgi:hypothetical protein
MMKKSTKWKLFPQIQSSLLLTFLFACLVSNSNAQITIGAGTNNDYYPINLTSGYSRDATIYTASELNTLTAGGIITTLAWNGVINSNTTAPLKIYLKAIGTTAEVTSDTWANTIMGATLVYDGTLPSISNNWNTVDITDFSIGAGQNIEVLVEANYGNEGINPFAVAAPKFDYTPAGLNTHGTIITNYTAPTNETLTLNNRRPDIRIGGLTPPSCSPPSALSISGVTGTDANVNITAPTPTPTSYDYYFSTANTAPDATTTPTGNVAATPISLTGLNYATTYYVWVRSRCSSTDISNWSSVTSFTTIQSPPANDECANAIALMVNADLNCTNTISANTTGATQSAQPAGGAINPAGINDDIWYEFTATATSHKITLEYQSGNEMTMSLYSGSCGSLTYLNSASSSYYEEMNATGLTVGTTYKIRVYTGSSNPGVYATFTLCVGTTPPPPLNDECANAVALTISTTPNCVSPTAGTTAFATHSNELAASSQNNPGNDDDVWYQFTATSTIHRITLSDFGSSDMVMILYSGACGNLTSIQEANSAFLSSTMIVDVAGLTVNTTYKIRVYTYTAGGAQANFNICVGPPPPPPANDDCPNAIALTANTTGDCNFTQSGTTLAATQSNETLSSGQNSLGIDDDVWYKFTATSTAHRLSLSDISPVTDMEMAVYSGSCGSLTFLAVSGFGSYIDVTGLTVGTEYKVRIYTFNSSGYTSFNICLGPKPPVNDEAAGAIALTLNAGCTGNPYDNTTATQSATEPDPYCSGGYGGYAGMWYKFVAPASGMVKVSCDGGGTMDDSRMALFSATDPEDYSSFSIIACDDQNGVISSNRSLFYASGLTAGSTYYINVDCQYIPFPSPVRGTYCVTVDEMSSSMLTAADGDCIAGQNITDVNSDYHGWMSLVDNSGNLVANIRQLSGNATTFRSSTTIKTGTARTDYDGTPYLNRNFLIRGTGAGSTDVQLFFTDAELTNVGSPIENLNVTKVSGNACVADFVYTPGTNTFLSQTANGHPVSGVNYVQVNTPGFSNFYIMPGTTPLPLELISFSGQNKGLTNQLIWKTVNEKNFSHFELQRSGDGIKFAKLAEIMTRNAKGESNYEYMDAQPLKGKTFYRLNMVDINGKSFLSTVVELKNKAGGNLAMSLFPNPVSKSLKLVIDGNADPNASIQVIDIIGKVVKTVKSDSNITEIDMSNLADGTYIIKYNSSKDSFIGKVIKN